VKYLLDTDICIYLIKSRPPQVVERFRRHAITDIALSTITLFELGTGVLKSAKTRQNEKALTAFSRSLPILDFTQEAATRAAVVRAGLESQGTPIGAYDVLIAGIALAEGLTLVSNNVGEFSRIDGLKLENWAA